jgi:uncharacterized protein (DUF2141 family)
MKRMARWCLVAAVAALVVAPAFAQGRFDLKKETGADVQPLFTHATKFVAMRPAKAAREKVALPEKISGSALFGTLKLGNNTVAMVLDGNQLYTDPTGNLKDARPVELPSARNGVSPAVPVTVALPDGSVTISVTAPNVHFLAIHPAEAMVGTVQVAGQYYKVAVVDGTLSGKWNDTFSPVKTSPATSAIFAIDLNGNGKFDDDPAAGEIMPLGQAIQVAGVWYAYEVAADGSAITCKKFEGDLGTISVPDGNLFLILSSDNGVSTVTGSAGKFAVPSGKYTVTGLALAASDKDGAKWTLMAQPAKDLAAVEVAKGETTALKAGAPLVVKAEAARTGHDVSIGLAILGQGGEKYAAGALKNGTIQPSPKFKIFDESGKEIGGGELEYG